MAADAAISTNSAATMYVLRREESLKTVTGIECWTRYAWIISLGVDPPGCAHAGAFEERWILICVKTTFALGSHNANA